MIPKETIEKIFDAVRIEEVVGDFVTLKKRGVNLLGLCPFHNEKTPSFTVSPSKGIFKCFGCGESGSAVNFLMKHEHFTYPEALRYLANKYGIEVAEEKETPQQKEAKSELESLFAVNSFAQKHFSKNLYETPKGRAIGLSYFNERGFTDKTVKDFQLGYSPETWDDVSKAAMSSGYKKEYLEKSGLSIVKPNQIFDRFRNRVIFPIHNLSGRVIGFGARILTNDKKQPKYLNSPESIIYNKSKVLYGIYFAKTDIVRQDLCYLVEGYTDVISLHQAGIKNVVASSGTSLTEGQIRLIQRYSENIVILYDGDPAGIKASFRGIDMILEQGMNVRIVLFPEGEDPDSYARSHTSGETTTFLKEHSDDFIHFKANLLLKETNNDPIKRANAIEDIAKSISLIPNQFNREEYIRQTWEILDIDQKSFTYRVNTLRTSKEKKKPYQERQETKTEVGITKTPATATTALSEMPLEKEVIRLLITYGNYVITIGDKKDKQELSVAEFIINELLYDSVVFDNPVNAKIFNEYKECVENDFFPKEKHFFRHEDGQVRKKIIDLVSTPYSLSDKWADQKGIFTNTEEDNLRSTVENVLLDYKVKRLEKELGELGKKIKHATEEELMPLLKRYNDQKQKHSEISIKRGKTISK